MANTYTTSKIVRLYDQRTPTKLLHPETELSGVVCTSGGLVVIDGNSISVPEASVGSVISASGFIREPIIAEATGGTVTNIGNSTGYGTLLKTISTTDTVRLPATSASNDYIPTELAVAVGLDKKQNILSAGSFITLTPDDAGHDIIAVSPVTTEIRNGTSAVHTALPTEKAVQIAIGVASASAVTEAMTSVGAAGYATQTWAQQTFLASGGPHDWSYANNQAAGVVRPVAGSGLVIGDSGALTVQTAPQYATYATASAGSAGMVRVTSEVVSAANATQSALTVVPTTDAVYRAIQQSISGHAAIVEGDGIDITSDTPLTGYTVSLEIAASNNLGGVMVPNNGGLTVNGNGSLTLSGASVYTAYDLADAGYIGGVKVMNTIESSAGYSLSNYVPNVYAVYTALGNYVKNTAYAQAGSAGVVKVGNGLYMDSSIPGGTQDALTLRKASIAALGGVQIASGSNAGLGIADGILSAATPGVASTYAGALTSSAGVVRVVNVITNDDTYKNSAIVPNAQAVYSCVSSAVANDIPVAGIAATASATSPTVGGVRIVSGGGLQITTGTTAGNLYLDSATYTQLGGVTVPYETGLELSGGTITISSGYKNAFLVQSRRTSEEIYGEPLESARVQVQNQLVLDSTGRVLYYNPNTDSADLYDITGPTVTTLFAQVIKSGTSVFAIENGTAGDRYSWTTGESLYTMAADPATGDPIFASSSGPKIIGYVDITGTTTRPGPSGPETVKTLYADIWSCTISPISSASTDSICTAAVATVTVDSAQQPTIYQYQHDPIISGVQSLVGGGTASIYATAPLASAATDSFGGVRLVKNIDGVGSTYDDQALAPTLGAVVSYVAEHGGSGGGTADPATPIFSTAAEAAASQGGYGTVKLVSTFEGLYDVHNAEAYGSMAYAPTLYAVKTYVDAQNGALIYDSDFAVTHSSGGGATYVIHSGAVYQDGTASSGTIGATSLQVSSTGVIWLTLSKTASGFGGSYGTAPIVNGTATSYPIAYVSGGRVMQKQLGPIIVRGRWA